MWFSEEKCFKYFVKWKNYDNSENTWEPIRSLKSAGNMVEEFE